jgi:hypothetical protein
MNLGQDKEDWSCILFYFHVYLCVSCLDTLTCWNTIHVDRGMVALPASEARRMSQKKKVCTEV